MEFSSTGRLLKKTDFYYNYLQEGYIFARRESSVKDILLYRITIHYTDDRMIDLEEYSNVIDELPHCFIFNYNPYDRTGHYLTFG